MDKFNTWKSSAISAWALVAILLIGGTGYLFTAKAEVTAARAQHDKDTGRLFACIRTVNAVQNLAADTRAWADTAVAEGTEWINVNRYATAVQRNADFLDCK